MYVPFVLDLDLWKRAKGNQLVNVPPLWGGGGGAVDKPSGHLRGQRRRAEIHWAGRGREGDRTTDQKQDTPELDTLSHGI